MKLKTLWMIAPIYQDVESFLRLRERTLEIISRHLLLRRTRLRFVAVDDTGGFDPEMQRLRALRDVTRGNREGWLRSPDSNREPSR